MHELSNPVLGENKKTITNLPSAEYALRVVTAKRCRKSHTHICTYTQPGPSCSKLTTSLVNDSLKFTSSDTQIC